MDSTLFANIPAAIDGGTIAGLIFIVISFLGWIINLINQKQQQQNRPAVGAGRPRRPMNESERRLRSELDAFLEEAGDRRRPPEQAQGARRPRPPRAEEPIELVFEPERESARSPLDQTAEVGSLTQRHLESGVSTHVAEYMERQVGDNPERRTFAERKSRFFGGPQDTSAEAAAPGEAAPFEIRRLLRDPNGVRQAILLNEILSPCKGRRGA